MREPHAFSQFVRILGRGKNLTRSLTEAEAEEAMGAILDGQALPEQIGAFLMLLRVKEESPEEIAGFVRAARARLALPGIAPRVDFDWSSYAGKKRQLPWFLLAALRLASAGWRVMMHGGEGHTEGRLYTSAALRALGLAPDVDLDAAAARLEQREFRLCHHRSAEPPARRHARVEANPGPALAGEQFCPDAQSVRGAGHAAGRVSPRLHAPAPRRGTPARAEASGGVSRRGREIERRPSKPCEVYSLSDGAHAETRWPSRLEDPRQEPDEAMDLARLGAVWRGEVVDAYADAAVAGTMAIALHALGAADVASAEASGGRTLAEPRQAPPAGGGVKWRGSSSLRPAPTTTGQGSLRR